jgi:hypothetical protein
MSEENNILRATRRHELLFGVRKSVRYHARRRQFFDKSAKAIKIISVVGGIGTVSTLLAKASPSWPLAYSVVAGIGSTVDLVIGCSESARRHAELAREFLQLERRMIKAGDNVTDAEIAGFTCDRLEIEEKEPTVLRVLDLLCHNELCNALGYDRSHQIRLSWFQRCSAHFFDSGLSRIERQTTSDN